MFSLGVNIILNVVFPWTASEHFAQRNGKRNKSSSKANLKQNNFK